MLAYESLWRIRWRMFQDCLAKHHEKALEGLESVASRVVELFKSTAKPARESFQTTVGTLEGYIQSQNLTELLSEFDGCMSSSKN